MLSSSVGSLGLPERARLLCFAQTGVEGAFEDMVMVCVRSMKERKERDSVEVLVVNSP